MERWPFSVISVARATMRPSRTQRKRTTPRNVVGFAGGELYVWTVDDARRIRSLESLGVTGVITNDPRLFQPIEQVAAE